MGPATLPTPLETTSTSFSSPGTTTFNSMLRNGARQQPPISSLATVNAHPKSQSLPAIFLRTSLSYRVL